MATYVPNADDTAEPVGSRTVKSAAPEFRTLKTKVARTVTVPEAGELPELPAIVDRANKVFAFDSLGNPIAIVGVAAGSAAALQLLLADVISAMNGAGMIGRGTQVVNTVNGIRSLSKTAISTAVEVLGYWAPGDGCDSRYYLDVGDVTSADNGGSIIVGTDGGRWKLVVGSVATTKSFGVIGNGTDEAVQLQAAISYVQSHTDPALYASNSPYLGPTLLDIQDGMFVPSVALVIQRKVTLRGAGPGEFSSGSRLRVSNVNADLIRVEPIAQGMSVAIEDLTLRGSGSGTGDLIKVTFTTAGCNSQRYTRLVFGTPSRLALNILSGDDVVAQALLFDVSAGGALSLGAAATVVSNARFDNTNFFQIPTNMILLVNVTGLVISNTQVYPSNPINRLTHFINGTDSIPTLIESVQVLGGTIRNVDCLFTGTAVLGLTLANLNCVNASGGAAARPYIELFGVCTDIILSCLRIKGNFGAQYVVDTSGATSVTGGSITGCVFVNTAGASRALRIPNFAGVVANNYFVGFAAPSVSQKVFTAGNAVAPGVVGAGLAVLVNFVVTDSMVSDRVEMGVLGGVWVAPVGIEIEAYISAVNTVEISYRNVTGAPIGVPAHDISYMVVRGA